MSLPRHSSSRRFGITDLIPPAARRPATFLVLLFTLATTIIILFAPTFAAPEIISSSTPYIPDLPVDFEEQIHIPEIQDHIPDKQYDTPEKQDDTPEKQDDTPQKQGRGPISPDYTTFHSGHLPAAFDDPLYSTLSDRLVRFLNRPTYTHEESREYMTEHCPLDLADGLVNPDQYKGSIDFWKGEVGRDVILEKRAELVRWLEGRIEDGEKVVWEEGMGGGQGIVMTGGNKDTAARLIFQLRHLKRLGVTLPVEVFHYPGELTNTDQRSEIESLGATIIEIKGVTQTPGAWKNWQLKSFSLIQSSFREILSLDSDNAPLSNPSHLFSSTIYENNGRAAFWPDLNKDHPDNAIWRIIGEQCTFDDWSFESGQMVIDKSGNEGLNLAALYLASAMMDDKDFWFKMCGGDKDTFRWAWRALDIDFGRSPRWMSSVGIMDRGKYCGHTVLQYDLATLPGEDRPRPLFAHSNLLKHLRAYGLTRGKLFTHIKRLSLDTYPLNALNYAHQFVYTGSRGMCLDIEFNSLADRLSDAEKEEFKIEVLEVGDVEGRVFGGFEDSFFDLGGKAGGW